MIEDRARAVALFDAACQAGAACGKAGLAYATGDGVERDDNRAWNYLRDGCAEGDALSCKGYRAHCHRLGSRAACEASLQAVKRAR